MASLRCHSCLIDGEAVACDDQGIPDFKLLIRDRKYGSAQLYAFDLLELDGQDLRRDPIEARKRALNKLLGSDRAGLLISHPIDQLADVAFQHVCELGLEGIVSKKLGSRYESGRSSLWLCVMDIRATQSKNETSMRTFDSTLSLIRRGPYEPRVMKFQEDTEGLWLELIDHHRKRTIDSYRGRDLEDIAVAARSLRSRTKMLRRAGIRPHP